MRIDDINAARKCAQQAADLASKGDQGAKVWATLSLAYATLATLPETEAPAESLSAVVDRILLANPYDAADATSGKAGAMGKLVGLVMQATKGKADVAFVQDAIRSRVEPKQEHICDRDD